MTNETKKRKWRTWLGIGMLLLLFLAWVWIFPSNMVGYEELILEPGQTSFTAPFSRVFCILPSNNDVTIADIIDSTPAAFHIWFKDEYGTIVGESFTDSMMIHSNGFASVENQTLEGLPIELTPGHKYKLYYEAVCGGYGLTDLTFALYGEMHSFYLVALILSSAAVLSAILLVLLIQRPLERTGTYLFLWLIGVLLCLAILPKTASLNDMSCFSDVYAESSRILGRKIVDQEGFAFIEESGLRQMGYMGSDVALHRFYLDWSFGNVRSSEKTSIWMQTSNFWWKGPIFYFQSICLAILRLFRVPYQFLYLGNGLINIAIAFVIISKCIHKAKQSPEKEILLLAIFVMPSFLQSLCVHAGNGLLILMVLWTCFLLLDNRKKSGTIFFIILALELFVRICNIFTWIYNSLKEWGTLWHIELLHRLIIESDSWIRSLVSDGGDEDPLHCLGAYALLLCIVLLFHGCRSDKCVSNEGKVLSEKSMYFLFICIVLLSWMILFTRIS